VAAKAKRKHFICCIRGGQQQRLPQQDHSCKKSGAGSNSGAAFSFIGGVDRLVAPFISLQRLGIPVAALPRMRESSIIYK
jgi:hypothetical protein